MSSDGFGQVLEVAVLFEKRKRKVLDVPYEIGGRRFIVGWIAFEQPRSRGLLWREIAKLHSHDRAARRNAKARERPINLLVFRAGERPKAHLAAERLV